MRPVDAHSSMGRAHAGYTAACHRKSSGGQFGRGAIWGDGMDGTANHGSEIGVTRRRKKRRSRCGSGDVDIRTMQSHVDIQRHQTD